jgi:pyrroloquinoline quinone (PQQ) biosynthesis protein C
MRAWIIQLYPFIESFPKWIALNLTKIHDPLSRTFMIDNLRVEKKHAAQWVYMAQGFGIPREELCSVQPLPEVEALTHWLWSVNTQGTLAEGVAATNYAIEGVTQDIAKLMLKGFPHYEGVEGVHLDKKVYWWAEAHARYDDLHPAQALEIMKLYATTKELEQKVMFAARRSLEYLLMALETCYTHFQPQDDREALVAAPRSTQLRRPERVH